MTKVETLARYIQRRLKAGNQPQVFGLPLIHKDLRVPRTPGGGSFIDNGLGNIRRAGMLREVGRIRTGVYYVFTARAQFLMERDPQILRRWISRGKHWKAP